MAKKGEGEGGLRRVINMELMSNNFAKSCCIGSKRGMADPGVLRLLAAPRLRAGARFDPATGSQGSTFRFSKRICRKKSRRLAFQSRRPSDACGFRESSGADGRLTV
jgi:hypothetical protein